MMREVGEDPSDEQLWAEFSILGAMMRDHTTTPTLCAFPLADMAFANDFHLAVYRQIVAIVACGAKPDAERVWEQASSHPDAGDYGLVHLLEAVEMFNPTQMPAHLATIYERFGEKLAEAAEAQSATRH